MIRLLLLLPFLLMDPPESGKGMAGYSTPAQLQEQGATWYHRWALCNDRDSAECVHHVKARWVMDEYTNNDLEHVRAAIAECRGGWFMFGDEYRLQDAQGWKDWSVSNQLDEFDWARGLIDEINPACKLAFGGVNPWHPATGSNVDWVAEFAEGYYQRHGFLPPVDAIMIDAYNWQPLHPDPYPDALTMIDEIHRIYGSGVEVWARETGCLLWAECAYDSVALLDILAPHLDRWAWFMSEDFGEGWQYTTLYDWRGNITPLGVAYAVWAEPEPPPTGTLPVPQMLHRTYVPWVEVDHLNQ